VAVSAHGDTPGRFKIRTPRPWTLTRGTGAAGIRGCWLDRGAASRRARGPRAAAIKPRCASCWIALRGCSRAWPPRKRTSRAFSGARLSRNQTSPGGGGRWRTRRRLVRGAPPPRRRSCGIWLREAGTGCRLLTAVSRRVLTDGARPAVPESCGQAAGVSRRSAHPPGPAPGPPTGTQSRLALSTRVPPWRRDSPEHPADTAMEHAATGHDAHPGEAAAAGQGTPGGDLPAAADQGLAGR
jgi:hypothetical protein